MEQMYSPDGLVTRGLAGNHNSLAYRVAEIERHFHSYECYVGAAVTANAEIHVADKLSTYTNTNIVNPFTIDAGNDNFGSWVQVLGSSDTPCRAGNMYFDLHDISFLANERNGMYIVQIAFGTSAAQSLTDETFTTVAISFDAANYGKNNIIQARRHAAGTKAWIRCLCPGQNTGTISFYLGFHEYEG